MPGWKSPCLYYANFHCQYIHYRGDEHSWPALMQKYDSLTKARVRMGAAALLSSASFVIVLPGFCVDYECPTSRLSVWRVRPHAETIGDGRDLQLRPKKLCDNVPTLEPGPPAGPHCVRGLPHRGPLALPLPQAQ